MAGKADVRAGGAYVEIGADITGVQKSLGKLKKEFEHVGKAFVKTGAVIAAGGGAVFAAIEGITHVTVEAGSAIQDMSERLNISTETLSALGYTASLAGQSLEDVEASLGKMQKSIAAGAQSGDKFFAGLIDADAETQLNAIAEKIASIENPTEQSAMAMEIFGKSGRKMLPFLKEGAVGLARMRAEAERAGAIWSKEEAEKADKYGDALTTIGTVIKSVGKAIGMAIVSTGLSSLEQLTEKIISIGQTVRDWIGKNQELFNTIRMVALGVMGAGVAIGALGTAIIGVGAVFGVLASSIGAVVAVLGFILSPIGLIVAGVTALGAGLVMAAMETETFKTTISELGDLFGQVWGGIKDAMAAGDLGAAMQIAWLGVQIVFDKGIGALEKVWIGFKFFFLETWDDIRAAAGIAWTAIGELAKGVINVMVDGLNLVIDGINTLIRAINKVQPFRDIGEVGQIGKIGGSQDPFRDQLDEANARDRARAADKKRQLDATGPDPALQAELDGLTAKAASDALTREILDGLAYARRGDNLAGQLGDAASSLGDNVKGAFASNLDARSFAFGDKGSPVEKNTERTAKAVEKNNELLKNMRMEWDD